MIRQVTDEAINLMPSTEVEEVMQNVRMILGIRRGTVPIERGLGLPTAAIDAPMQAARALMMTQAAKSITEYEPRARLVSMEATATADGRLEPVVRISIAEGG